MGNKSFILFVYERDMATVEGMRNVFRSILNGSETVSDFKKCTMIQSKDIEKADVLIMIRPHNYLSFKIAQKAGRSGCFVVFYMDDDMFHYPESMHSIPWRIRALKKTLKISDALMTGNPRILDKYKKYTVLDKGCICHTAVSKAEREMIPVKKERADKVQMVYAAGAVHSSSIEHYIVPVLDYLNENYQKDISMTFIGVHPDFDFNKYKFNIEYIEPMDLEEYRKWMLDHCYDIGFAPLENTPFNNHKYFNKFIEYTLTGVVGLYSNCQPYTYIVQDGVNGCLVNDNIDEWISKTISVITDKHLRQFMLENAVNQLAEEFSEKKVFESLKCDLQELFEKKKMRRHCRGICFNKLIYYFLLALDSLYLVGFYSKHLGWSGVIRKTVTHFRCRQVYK